MISNPKKDIAAPCAFQGKNFRGEDITEYPAVDCDLDCKHCGWSPIEAKRRMETGHFVYNENGLRSLHFDRA